ncbi:hypothetical protein KSP39_PZI015253 [Platanthera zijinensis]|uniref:Uncharacterized protein n=1 Tax=Platanthera zijinensis TaxID=2320716 RepID=A0AAP0B8A8_9ASPA
MGHRHQDSESPSTPLPLRTPKGSSPSFSCCFGSGAVDEDGRSQASPSSWLRSKASELPDIREKCRSLISNIGHRRHHSGDFGYDPISYALNFDEGSTGDSPVSSAGDLRRRGFSARLPASP